MNYDIFGIVWKNSLFQTIIIAVESGVNRISAENWTNLSDRSSKHAAFSVSVFLKNFQTSKGLVDWKLNNRGSGVFNVAIVLLIASNRTVENVLKWVSKFCDIFCHQYSQQVWWRWNLFTLIKTCSQNKKQFNWFFEKN